MGELKWKDKLEFEGVTKEGVKYTASFNADFKPIDIESTKNEIPIECNIQPLELTLKVKPIKLKKALKDTKYNKMLRKVDKLLNIISKFGYKATIQIDKNAGGENNERSDT